MLKQLAALSAALCGGTEAFATVQTKERASLAQFMTNDFDKHYEVELDRHGRIRDINASDLNRREAISKGAAAAAAAAALLSGPGAAYSDDTSDGPIGFSKSTSDAWRTSPEPEPVDTTARATPTPGGRTLADQFIKEEIGEASVNSPPRPGSLAEQFVREESGQGGSSRGPVSSPVSSTAAPQPTPSVSKPVVFSAKQLGAGAALSVAAAAYNAEYGDYSDMPATSTNVGRPSESISTDEVVAFDEVVEEEAVEVLVAESADAEPIIVQESSDEVTASPWDNPWFKAPVPYGMQNKASNPFIEQVEEYCVGGQVTPECTATITTYLDELSITGAVAKRGEAQAIAGYLDSLGSNSSENGKQAGAGAAFTSYLDAISSGSAPPPKSAAAVMSYLDSLKTNSQKPYRAIQIPEWKLREYFGVSISPLGGQQPTSNVEAPQLEDEIIEVTTPAQPYTPIEIPEWKLREYFGISDVQAQAEVQQDEAIVEIEAETSQEQAPTIPTQPYNPIEIPDWKLREYFGISDVRKVPVDAAPTVEVAQNQATYLDNLSTSSPQQEQEQYTPIEIPDWKLREYFGVDESTPKVGIQANVESRQDSDPLPPPAPIMAGGVLNGRLTLIENRVADLEIKVNELPDQVYEKIETWQTSQAEWLSDEVKRIVEAMENSTPPPLPPPTKLVVESSSIPSQGTGINPDAISVTIGGRVISTSPGFASSTSRSTASTAVQSSIASEPVSPPSTKKKGWGKSEASWKNNPAPKNGSGGSYLDNLKP